MPKEIERSLENIRLSEMAEHYFVFGRGAVLAAELRQMKIQSFIQDQNQLIPVEVELSLWPGIPGIQFLGMADRHLKESALRIKSAIKAQGFDFPKAQQILVNLRPSHLIKTSRGLELAVAAAYLWETEQKKKPLLGRNDFVYGELSLSGEVFEPEDLSTIENLSHPVVLTGRSLSSQTQGFTRQVIRNLASLASPEMFPGQKAKPDFRRPPWGPEKFSQREAELLQIVALGEHSVLLAGPAGAGKSTIAKALHLLLAEPDPDRLESIYKVQKKFSDSSNYLPLVKPHHSIPLMSMIGGGSVPLAGEISRAHGGILLLDELLEFKPQIQEALREPFEEGLIRVARAGKLQIFPAQSLIVATTNLCPCGEAIPGEKKISCRFSKTRCDSYSQRLSGPLLDRFQILYFKKQEEERQVSLAEIFVKVEKARAFQKSQGRRPATWQSLEDLEKDLEKNWQKSWREAQISERRNQARLRVARTFADLNFQTKITSLDLQKSENWSLHHFERMKRWDL